VGNNAVVTIVSILTAIVGVAIVAVLVDPQSQSVSAIKSAGNAFSCVLSTALSPIGASTSGCSSGGLLTPLVQSTITFGDM
jgi:hypothetical protein